MNTNSGRVIFLGSLPMRSPAARVGRFLWHFLQMVIAMEVGMMIYHKLLFPLLAPTGFGALTNRYPLFGYWMMVVSMLLGMIVLMFFHRSSWRYSLEMTLAMVAPLAILTTLVVCNLFPTHVLYGVGDPLMFVAMAAFMLFRPAQHAHGGHEAGCHAS